MRVLDLGTGSGAIAVTLAKLRPQARVTAVDVDYAALAVARANAGRHKASVRFFCGDWFGALSGETFDLIVSNLGVNNFEDRAAAIHECRRVARRSATVSRDPARGPRT